MARGLAGLVVVMACAASAQEVPVASADSASAKDSERGLLQRVSLGGYGEGHLVSEATKTQATLKRFVLFAGFEFNDWLRLRSELEVEDAHEFEVEQAYLEATPLKQWGARGGLMLVPVGLINLSHEPPTFHGVDRPMVEQVIIPSTWRELGLGVFGTPLEGLHVQLYAMNGLDGDKFTAASGIRNGRGEGVEAHAEDPAVTGRVNFNRVLGLDVGASFYFGGAAQDVKELGGVRVGIVEADGRFTRWGLDCRAEYVRVFVTGADKIIASQRATDPAAEPIGAAMQGFLVEAAYDVMRPLKVDQELLPFARFESVDTRAMRASVLAPGSSLLSNFFTAGLTYRPHPQVAVKLDYRRALTLPAGDPTSRDRFSLGVGFMF